MGSVSTSFDSSREKTDVLHKESWRDGPRAMLGRYWMPLAALFFAAIAGVGWTLSRWVSEPPSTGVQVHSVPSGAEVFVDGARVGKAPVLVGEDMPRGTELRLELRLDGHERWTKAVRVAERVSPVFAELAPLRATLRVETTPPGARVFLDGSFRGPSPLEIPGLAVRRKLTLRASKQGYADATAEVTITAANLQPGVALVLTKASQR